MPSSTGAGVYCGENAADMREDTEATPPTARALGKLTDMGAKPVILVVGDSKVAGDRLALKRVIRRIQAV